MDAGRKNKGMNNNVLKLPVLIVYVIVFYSIWTMWELGGKVFFMQYH